MSKKFHRSLFLGHWPSYNIPFYESVYNMSGYPYVVALKGLEFSYQMAPRAKIFRRDADKVETMDDMMRFMRYNGERFQFIVCCTLVTDLNRFAF